MIHYDLQCERGHEFDGWFASSDAFDRQLQGGQVTCTHCGTGRVEKQLMAPGIPVKSNARSERKPMASGRADPRMADMMKLMREYRREVEAHSEDVGHRFAEEARRIHYREAEERGIRGQATPDEAQALMEEGIPVHPLPILPEDTN